MVNQLQKIQKISKSFDRLFIKGLGFMFILILIVGLTSYNSTPTDSLSGSGSNFPLNDNSKISYKNCVTGLLKDYTVPDLSLFTNTKIGLVDLIEDTDYAGIGKDGIPKLVDPKSITITQADTCVSSNEDVYIVIYNNIVKLYPKNLLTQHQVINERFGESKILIAYSPFTDSATAFLSRDEFGISGRIYKGNTLLYDKTTESLWLQLTGKAIVGDKTGEQLTKIVIQKSSYGKARNVFPESEIVTYDTGYNIKYDIDPYTDFHKTSLPYGDINYSTYETDPKEIGIIFEFNNIPYFYALSELASSADDVSYTNVGYKLYKNEILGNFEVVSLDNNGISNIIPFTYGYYYSYTEIYNNKAFY